jgi:hypothetical protein
LKNQLVVNNGKLVVATANVEKVATKKVAKKVKSRDLYGIRFGEKPNSELRNAVKVMSANKDKKNMTFDFILSEYKKSMIKNDKVVTGKNFEGRLRRILYRSIESGLTRKSVQGIEFNLSANYYGIKIVLANPFIFDSNANVDRKQVEANLYTFKFNKVVKVVTKAEFKTVKDKVEAFQSKIR